MSNQTTGLWMLVTILMLCCVVIKRAITDILDKVEVDWDDYERRSEEDLMEFLRSKDSEDDNRL